MARINKTMMSIKINRLNRRFNDWVLNVLCYPVTFLERKVKRYSQKEEVYKWGTPERYM